MQQIELLQDLVIIFGLSVVIVLIFQRIHLPSIVGFLISGALLGPYGLNLIDDVEQVEVLAEVGIVLLLFTIGLEFSLSRLSGLRTFALLGGALQVGITIALTALITWAFQLPVRTGIFWGFLIALSSTAIVLKILIDREELDAAHGRLVLGILIFQDLIVVPMILIMPLLGEETTGNPTQVVLALGRSLLLVGAILIAARWLVPKALVLVVRARSRELFVISVLLICSGIAWLASWSGLSLALGAFIAGLVISESEYSHQALADIMPFRYSFNSLFFVSIGMLLDVRFFFDEAFLALGLSAAVLILKCLIAGGVTIALGYSFGVATMVGLSLAQVGEFSFVLAQAGLDLDLLSGSSYQLFLVISILSMISTPFLIQFGPMLLKSSTLTKEMPRWLRGRRRLELEPRDLPIKGHVVIAGYGLNGRNVARVLRETEIPYVILDLHGDAVRHARSQGEPIYFGDVTRIRVLRHVRIQDAKILVLALSDPFADRRAVQVVRQANPNIHIIVRTRYLKEVEELFDLGADAVVPEEFETSLEIFDLVLQQYRIPTGRIAKKKGEVRKEGYAKLRRGEIEPYIEQGTMPEELQVERYTIKEGSPVIGKKFAELELRAKSAAMIVAITRGDKTHTAPGGPFEIHQEDILVLVGTKDDLDAAIGHFEAYKEKG
jgi:monovalent cation:H+ antiporter-2, CPA2 family